LDDKPFLSVIVPCYNERENLLRGVLAEMSDYLMRRDYAYEVLISDDGSSDDSKEIVSEQIANLPHFSLLRNEHGGKPWAVWCGIEQSRGEHVLFTDMDQSAPLCEVAKLLPELEAHEVAIGSRGGDRANFPLYRRLGSALFRNFRRLFLLRGIYDTQCGFKAMRREVGLELFPLLEAVRSRKQAEGWRVTAFDVELLYLAERRGYTIAEVPVEWANRDAAANKGKSYLTESKEMASQILRVFVNAQRGFYDREQS